MSFLDLYHIATKRSEVISNLPNGKYIELAAKPTYRKTKNLSIRFIVRFERLFFLKNVPKDTTHIQMGFVF